ncbi:glycosyltransferase [Falsirhodobacter sp. 1013]|uniref:glycosyltransferase n=1 Tax=Falsirhodobacter sp. 1013 TaxID=3417566 RepID=UPI003EBF7C14
MITVLLAAFNGARHLPEQLSSIAAQEGVGWRLWVSDDGSTDATRAVVKDFAVRHPDRQIRLMDGPRQGSAANFLSLLHHPDLPPGPVAFSDQDDVWLPDRLRRALTDIGDMPHPTLYASTTLVCGPELEHPRLSRSRGMPAFENALVQNIMAGNTMVLNAEAVACLRALSPASPVPFHDWWIYLALAALRAHMISDPRPSLLYRQHGGNELGDAARSHAFLRRLKLSRQGHYASWIRANVDALLPHAHKLDPDRRDMLKAFGAELGTGGPARVRRLMRMGIRRDRRRQTALLYAAALAGRV